MSQDPNGSSDRNIISEITELENDTNFGEAPEGVSPEIWNNWKQWKMRPPNDFIYQVERGMTGANTGLSNGLTNINRYIYGTHQARYYLLGADSGVGKTTIGDFMYVLKAWESARKLGRRIKIFYCSFEIGKLDKTARWVSYYVYAKFGARLPSDYILGRITGKLLTPEHKRMVVIGYQAVTEMMQDIIFIEDVVHPTKIFEDLIEAHFEHEGTVHRAELTPEQKIKHRKGYVKGYTAKDPDLITILLIDHLALTGTEQGLDTKHIMDRMSKYAVVLRNMFHCTTVFIQQFSTDIMSWHRSNKKSVDSIAPQRIDFGDSKATFRDADVILGFTKPVAQDYEEFKGYSLIADNTGVREGALGHCFIANYIMKNRYGPSGRLIPLFLDGITGHVYDLPLEPNNPLAMAEWYVKAKQIEEACQIFCPAE